MEAEMLIQHERCFARGVAVRDLVEPLQGLFHHFFTSLLSRRQRLILKGKLRKSVSCNACTVFTSICVKIIWLLISVSVDHAPFWIFLISAHPFCKNNREPQNRPQATCPEKNAANKRGDKTCLGGSGGLLLMHICSSWLRGAVQKPLVWEWGGAAESAVVPTSILLLHVQE